MKVICARNGWSVVLVTTNGGSSIVIGSTKVDGDGCVMERTVILVRKEFNGRLYDQIRMS